jgi:hypothetical protein
LTVKRSNPKTLNCFQVGDPPDPLDSKKIEKLAEAGGAVLYCGHAAATAAVSAAASVKGVGKGWGRSGIKRRG